MVRFCEDDVHCRRHQLLRHFDERFDVKNCRETCDDCQTKSAIKQMDFSKEARAIVAAVQNIPRNQNFTLAHFVMVFRGSTNKKIKDARHDRTAMSGLGKTLSVKLCHRIFHELLLSEFLAEEEVKNRSGYSNTYLRTGRRASFLMNGRENFTMAVRGGRGRGKNTVVVPNKAKPTVIDGYSLRLPADVFEKL